MVEIFVKGFENFKPSKFEYHVLKENQIFYFLFLESNSYHSTIVTVIYDMIYKGTILKYSISDKIIHCHSKSCLFNVLFSIMYLMWLMLYFLVESATLFMITIGLMTYYINDKLRKKNSKWCGIKSTSKTICNKVCILIHLLVHQ